MIEEHTSSESAEGRCSQVYSLLNVVGQVTVRREYAAKVGELLSRTECITIYIFKRGMCPFELRLAVTSYRRRHHGDASSASL